MSRDRCRSNILYLDFIKTVQTPHIMCKFAIVSSLSCLTFGSLVLCKVCIALQDVRSRSRRRSVIS